MPATAPNGSGTEPKQSAERPATGALDDEGTWEDAWKDSLPG